MAQLSCYYFKPAAGNTKLFIEHCIILLYDLLKLDLGFTLVVLVTKFLRFCCLYHKALSASENILGRDCDVLFQPESNLNRKCFIFRFK